MLQALRSLVSKPPPAGHRLAIFGTTASLELLSQLGIAQVFQTNVHVPLLRTVDEIKAVWRERAPGLSEKQLARFMAKPAAQKA